MSSIRVISVFSILRRTVAVALVSGFLQASVFATTILEVDVDFLLQTAELIFEGEVVRSEAAWNEERSAIFTNIRFRVIDVIKGEHGGEFVSLKYAGGIVGNQGMRVSSMVYPQLGERGIYFIESKTQQLINPMVGWGQGHFVLTQDSSGTERVLTEGRKKVLSLSASELPQAANARARSRPAAEPSEFSHGVARGIVTEEDASAVTTAMDKKRFKQALRERLGVRNGEVQR